MKKKLNETLKKMVVSAGEKSVETFSGWLTHEPRIPAKLKK